LIAGLVAALLAVSLLAIVVVRQPRFQKWLNPPQANLPEDSEIESMQMTIDNSVYFDKIDEFHVPPEHIPRILYWFRQSTYTQLRPFASDLIGRLQITTRQGETRTFTFYDFGANPILFTENNVDFYFGGGTIEPTNVEGLKPSGGLGYCGSIVVGNAIKKAHSGEMKK